MTDSSEINNKVNMVLIDKSNDKFSGNFNGNFTDKLSDRLNDKHNDKLKDQLNAQLIDTQIDPRSRETKPAAANSPLPSSSPMQQPTRKKLLETSEELKRALSSWDELSRTSPKLSADEQMLQEIKGLLSQLKNQLETFE